MEECLTIPKNMHGKKDTLVNKYSEICGAFRHKTDFHQFFLSTDDPINGWNS